MESSFFHEKSSRRRTDAALTSTLNQPHVYRLALVLSPIPICVALRSGNSPLSDCTCISNQPLSHNNNNNNNNKNAREEISHMPGSWLLSAFGATQPYDPHYTESFKWPLRCYLQKANMAAISAPPLLLAKDARKYLTLQRCGLAASANSHFQGQMLHREYGR